MPAIRSVRQVSRSVPSLPRRRGGCSCADSPRVAKGAIALRKLAHGADGSQPSFSTPCAAGGRRLRRMPVHPCSTLRKNNVHTVLILPSRTGPCRRMVELFGFDDVVVLDQDVLWHIVDLRACRSARGRGPGGYALPVSNGSVAQMQGYKGLNFEKMFRHHRLISAMTCRTTFRRPVRPSAAPSVLKLFDEQGWTLAVRLCCRHTQTRSFMSRIRAFWEMLAARCRRPRI